MERKEAEFIKNYWCLCCPCRKQLSPLLLGTWQYIHWSWKCWLDCQVTRKCGGRSCIGSILTRAGAPNIVTQHSCILYSHHCQGCRTLIITGKEITQYSLMRRLLWEFDCIMKMLLWKVLPIVLNLRLASKKKKSVTCFDRLLRKILCLLH